MIKWQMLSLIFNRAHFSLSCIFSGFFCLLSILLYLDYGIHEGSLLCCLNCDVTRDLLFNLCFVHQPKMADSRWRKFPAPLFTIFTWTVMQLVYPPKILHNLLSLISLGMTVIPRRNWKQWHMHNVFLAGEGGGGKGGG